MPLSIKLSRVSLVSWNKIGSSKQEISQDLEEPRDKGARNAEEGVTYG